MKKNNLGTKCIKFHSCSYNERKRCPYYTEKEISDYPELCLNVNKNKIRHHNYEKKYTRLFRALPWEEKLKFAIDQSRAPIKEFDFNWFENQENFPEKSQYKEGQEIYIGESKYLIVKVYYTADGIEALDVLGLTIDVLGLEFIIDVFAANELYGGIKIDEL